MPARDGSVRRTAPAADSTSFNTETAEPSAVQPVRVYSLTGVGYVDDRFGVSFVEHAYADVAPDLAQRMVAYRPEVVQKDEQGNDTGVGPGTEPVYSLTEPSNAVKTTADDPTGGELNA